MGAGAGPRVPICASLDSESVAAFDNPNSAGQECDVIRPNRDTCERSVGPRSASARGCDRRRRRMSRMRLEVGAIIELIVARLLRAQKMQHRG